MKTFKDLEVGDEVLVVSREGTKIEKVERKTKTQLVVRTSKYRISDGRLVGAREWNHSYIKIANDIEMKEQKEKEYMLKLTRNLHNFKGYGKFSVEKLEKICEIIGIELPNKG